jgi:hypothetical protein
MQVAIQHVFSLVLALQALDTLMPSLEVWSPQFTQWRICGLMSSGEMGCRAFGFDGFCVIVTVIILGGLNSRRKLVILMGNMTQALEN